jgi:hypothetical protein
VADWVVSGDTLLQPGSPFDLERSPSSDSTPESYAAQRSLRGIIRHADATVVEEAGEVGPALEHVIDRLQDLRGTRERLAFAQVQLRP